MESAETIQDERVDDGEEYRRLQEQHQECERRLEELSHSSLLSQQDEMEEKRIKKMKLSLKDRMASLKRRATARLTPSPVTA